MRAAKISVGLPINSGGRNMVPNIKKLSKSDKDCLKISAWLIQLLKRNSLKIITLSIIMM